MNKKSLKLATLSLFLIVSGLLIGCGSGALRTISSGQTGCAPAEIEITDDDIGFNTRSWTATCGGKTYYCSGGAGVTASCKPASGAR